jgi:hypothetical protein
VTFRTKNLTQAACTAALLAVVVSSASADTIKLTNGDVLTGTVIDQTDKAVTLDHAILGKITLQASRIASVKITDADQPAAESKSPNADAKQGEASGPNAEATEQAALKAAAEDKSFWQHFQEDWDSRLTLGLNGSSGPTDRQDYRIKFKTGFEDGRDRVQFDTSWYYATANGRQSQNQFQANLTKDWLQKDEPWFFFVKGQYKFDDNRSWENRTSAFGGGGYTLTKTEDVEVNTRLGFGGTYEYGSVNDFTPEALFGGSVIKWHVSERSAVSGTTLYYPSLEDTANFRVESSIEWTYKLDMADGLSLKLGVENEYDSATPNETGNNDVRYYGAIVLSF